ncbi:hypothetical protein [Nocardiopsis sp. MG754419]|nr:hypothetical protein [Nocardiopsis sp. MG754419]
MCDRDRPIPTWGDNRPLSTEEEEAWRRQGERLARDHGLTEPEAPKAADG